MSFQSILGQEQATNILLKALQSNRLAHAYLFYGPESTGKKRTAMELAKALNCLETGPVEACGACLACDKIERQIHPDFFLIEPSRTTAREPAIKIDEIRDLQKKLAFLPYEGRTKVVILNDAEKMNPQACNAFLKTLEEPPASTVIVLVSAQPQQLLPTLISRCQGVPFHPLPEHALKSILAKQLDREVDPAELELRVLRSQGQVARGLDDQILKSAAYREELAALLQKLSFQRIDLLFLWSKSLGKDTARIQEVLDELYRLLRDLAALRSGCGDDHLLNRDIAHQLRPLAPTRSMRGFIKMAEAVLETKRALSGNANSMLALETMLMNFCEAA